MQSRSALTLVELVVVLSVLAATSGLLIPLFTGTIQNAHQVSTQRSLVHVAETFRDYWRDTKHVALDGVVTVANEANRMDIDWLFANPVTGDSTWGFSPNTQIGWRGPYLAVSTGDVVAAGEPHLIDAWNRPLVVQDVDPSASPRDVRIISAGANGVIDLPAATATNALTTTDVGDDLYVAIVLR